MKLNSFVELSQLLEKNELEKVRLLAYFHHRVENTQEFSREELLTWFTKLHLPRPNFSRLMSKIRLSRSFIRGSKEGSFKLHALDLGELQAAFPGIRTTSEEVISDDVILPIPVFEDTRGFVESLARQINASYDYNIFDGCAVLMRRLVEVLLILTYEHFDIEAEIKGADGRYLSLSKIISRARSSGKLKLSKDAKNVLDKFRELGNLSAHKVYYNCRRADLSMVAKSYRVAIEELLYKSGLRK